MSTFLPVLPPPSQAPCGADPAGLRAHSKAAAAVPGTGAFLSLLVSRGFPSGKTPPAALDWHPLRLPHSRACKSPGPDTHGLKMGALPTLLSIHSNKSGGRAKQVGLPTKDPIQKHQM